LEAKEKQVAILATKLNLLLDRVDGMDLQYAPMHQRLTRLLQNPTTTTPNPLIDIPVQFRNHELWIVEYTRMYKQAEYGRWKTTGVLKVKKGMLVPTKPGIANVSYSFSY
jgi:hypothetical protein